MIVPTRRWFAAAAAVAVLALPALAWPGLAPLLLAGNAVLVAALVLDAWRLLRAPTAGLAPRREAPPAFSVGRPLPITCRWFNPWPHDTELVIREAWPALVRVDVAEERRVRIAARGSAAETIQVNPVHRGKADAGPVSVRVAGPWGLAWRQATLEVPWRLVVFPPLKGVALRALLTPTERRREAGMRATRRLGEGRIFESLREWVPGEDTRTIDWKATARRGKVMARQYEDERRQQVMLVLDAGRMLTAEVDGRARLEDAIETVLHLAVAAVDHDDDVGLMVFSDKVDRFLRPLRGQRALGAILDALAGVEGRLVEPDYPAAFAFLAARIRKRAFTVICTDIIDRTASEAILLHTASLRPRHLPLAVTLRDPALERLATTRPASEDEAFRRAAAEELLLARAEALAELRQQGVLVLDVPPGDAARAAVGMYGKMKRLVG